MTISSSWISRTPSLSVPVMGASDAEDLIAAGEVFAVELPCQFKGEVGVNFALAALFELDVLVIVLRCGKFTLSSAMAMQLYLPVTSAVSSLPQAARLSSITAASSSASSFFTFLKSFF